MSEDQKPRASVYGETVVYDTSSSKTPLMYTQALSALFFLSGFIVFILETQFVRFMSVYLFTILFGVFGVTLVVVGQFLVAAFYHVQNRVEKSSDQVNGESRSGGLMGSQHLREIYPPVLVSVLAFIICFWTLTSWLYKFKKNCTHACDPSHSAPNVDNDPEWRIFYGTMTLNAIICLLAFFSLSRAVMAHLLPLRVVYSLYKTSS